MKKKLLILLLVMFFPFVANAAEVEVTTFDELKTNNVAGNTLNYTGTALDLTEDIELVSTLYIKADTVLNLNNHTLTLSGHSSYGIYVFNSLTINGGGTVQINDTFGISTSISGSPKVTINSGTFNHTGDYMFGLTNGEIIFNGGTFNGTYCVVNNFAGYYRENNSSYSSANGKIIINDGTFKTTEQYGAPVMNSDVAIIKGGTFTSSGEEGNAIWTEAPGVTTIEDGTFKATGNDAEVLGNDNGTVTVTGGIFDAAVTGFVPSTAIEYTNTTGMEVVIPKDELIIKAFDVVLEPTEEQTNKVTDALEQGFVIGKFFDVTAWLVTPTDNVKIEQVTEADEQVKVTLTIPTDLPAVQDGYTRIYKVVRIHNGEASVLGVVDNGDGTISFMTNAFSPYAVVYADELQQGTDDDEPTTDNPNTADKIILYVSALVISATAVTGTALYLNKRY